MTDQKFQEYYNKMVTNKEVTFPSREDTIEFVSTLFGQFYESFLKRRTDLHEEEKQARLGYDKNVVHIFTTFYLKEKVADENDWTYRLIKVLSREQVLEFSKEKPDFYKKILERFEKSDERIWDVFPEEMVFSIIGEKKLKLEFVDNK